MLKTFAFLATLYTANGPVVYVLDGNLSGADCIARMESGITVADVLAVIDERVSPMGEAHIPSVPPLAEDLSAAVLSCEFDPEA